MISSLLMERRVDSAHEGHPSRPHGRSGRVLRGARRGMSLAADLEEGGRGSSAPKVPPLSHAAPPRAHEPTRGRSAAISLGASAPLPSASLIHPHTTALQEPLHVLWIPSSCSLRAAFFCGAPGRTKWARVGSIFDDAAAEVCSPPPAPHPVDTRPPARPRGRCVPEFHPPTPNAHSNAPCARFQPLCMLPARVFDAVPCTLCIGWSVSETGTGAGLSTSSRSLESTATARGLFCCGAQRPAPPTKPLRCPHRPRHGPPHPVCVSHRHPHHHRRFHRRQPRNRRRRRPLLLAPLPPSPPNDPVPI